MEDVDRNKVKVLWWEDAHGWLVTWKMFYVPSCCFQAPSAPHSWTSCILASVPSFRSLTHHPLRILFPQVPLPLGWLTDTPTGRDPSLSTAHTAFLY